MPEIIGENSCADCAQKELCFAEQDESCRSFVLSDVATRDRRIAALERELAAERVKSGELLEALEGIVAPGIWMSRSQASLKAIKTAVEVYNKHKEAADEDKKV